MSVSISLKYYKRFLFLLFIISMYPWFTWNIPTAYVSCIGALYTMVLIFTKKNIFDIRRINIVVALLFLCLYLFLAKYNNIAGQIELFFQWIIFLGILSLKEEYKSDVIKFITKWFAVLLGFSLLFYIANIIGLPLPSTPITRENALKTFTNYYVFLSIDGQFRFQSVFLEPGHMTMGLAPLLFLNKYNYKDKYVLILILSQLFSFSLAGYVVMVIGYVYTILFSKESKKFLRIVVPISIVAIFSYVVSVIYAHNIVDELIVARLEWTGSDIVGNDRSGVYLDQMYDQTLKSSYKWVGQEWRSEFSEKGVAGYKLFFVMYGFVGLILCLLCYVKTVFSYSKNNVYSIGLLLVMLLLLWQNAYPIWWCLIIQLICGTRYAEMSELKYK